MNETEVTYPLLAAWQSGRLREAWNQERQKMKAQDPKLLDWVVDHTAAVRISAHISAEYQDLSRKVKWTARQHHSDPYYSDVWTDFYDDLQDDTLASYRGILQDISGNRNMMADEIQYSSSVAFQE